MYAFLDGITETCTFGGFRENKIYVANKWEIVNENQK